MKRIRRVVLILIIAVAVGVASSWDKSAMSQTFASLVDAVRSSVEGIVAAPVGSLPPSATGDTIAGLLRNAHVVEELPQIRGYQRGCARGQAPLTEPTAQSAQV